MKYGSSLIRRLLVRLYHCTAAKCIDVQLTDSSLIHWSSTVYKHYVTTLRRDHHARKMWFVFSCRHGNPKHFPLERARTRTDLGTSNLSTSAKKCDRTRGALPISGPLETMSVRVPDYSATGFRALLALECGTANRPFTLVNDTFFQ